MVNIEDASYKRDSIINYINRNGQMSNVWMSCFIYTC